MRHAADQDFNQLRPRRIKFFQRDRDLRYAVEVLLVLHRDVLLR
jgi:hypothetical protein